MWNQIFEFLYVTGLFEVIVAFSFIGLIVLLIYGTAAWQFRKKGKEKCN